MICYAFAPFVGNHNSLVLNSFFQAPVRAPAAAAAHPRPATMERPLQRPRTEASGEGTSSGGQPTRGPSSSGHQVVVGRLAATPDLMVRYWAPPGELHRRFVTLDTTLEPVYDPVTCTYVSSHSLQTFHLS